MTALDQPAGRARIKTAFRDALHLAGPGYLEAESVLRGNGARARPMLRAVAVRAGDPLTRFVAAAIAAWIKEPVDEFAAAMEMWRQLELSRRGTPSVGPRPEVAELMLTQQFGARLAPYLALRLLKESWPSWKTLASLLYLKRHRLPAVAPALARYALTTPLPKSRQLAQEALAATFGEQAVGPLLDAARSWPARSA